MQHRAQIFQIFKKVGVKLYHIFLWIECLAKELWVICCKSAVAISRCLHYFQNIDKIKSIVNLQLLRKTDTIFKKTIVYEGLQHGGKQKSVVLLVEDLEIWWRHSLKGNKCRCVKLSENCHGKFTSNRPFHGRSNGGFESSIRDHAAWNFGF